MGEAKEHDIVRKPWDEVTDFQQSTICPIATVINFDEVDSEELSVKIAPIPNAMSKSHRIPNKSSKQFE